MSHTFMSLFCNIVVDIVIYYIYRINTAAFDYYLSIIIYSITVIPSFAICF